MNKFVQLLVVSGVVLLSACSFSSKTPVAKAPAELNDLMALGAKAEVDGLKIAALRRYEEAGQLYPTSKLPWLRIAHIQFDSSNYGEAIVAAQQVVARDDSDKVASSILSVSGLRVASKAVADLRKNKGLVGSVRNEAQELANVLRDSLGESVLVPATATSNANTTPSPAGAVRATPKPRYPVRIAPTPASGFPPSQVRAPTGPANADSTQSGGGSPFGSLK